MCSDLRLRVLDVMLGGFLTAASAAVSAIVAAMSFSWASLSFFSSAASALPSGGLRDLGCDFIHGLLRSQSFASVASFSGLLLFRQVLLHGRDRLVSLFEQFVERLVLGLDAGCLLGLEINLQALAAAVPVQ